MKRSTSEEITLRPAVLLSVVAGCAALSLVGENITAAIREPSAKIVNLDCTSSDLNQRARVMRIGEDHVVITEGTQEVTELIGRSGSVALAHEITLPTYDAADARLLTNVPLTDAPGVSVSVYEGYRSGDPSEWHHDQADMVTAVCSNTDFTPHVVGDGK